MDRSESLIFNAAELQPATLEYQLQSGSGHCPSICAMLNAIWIAVDIVSKLYH